MVIRFNNGGFYIGSGTIDASALLQIDSTTQGTVTPRMTTTQRDAIATPITGLEIFNTTTAAKNIYNGSAWVAGGLTTVGFADFDTDVSDTMLFVAGSYLDAPSVSVASNGTTITLTIEQDGGGDLRVHFLTGIYIWDTTPAATLTLTAGTDTAPTMNYIWIDESTKTLQKNTTGFPVADIVRVSDVLCQSAASIQTDGVYAHRNWTDHLASATCGHLAHLNLWVRAQAATWISGGVLTPTVGASTFDIATTAAEVLQLHAHDYPAFDTSSGSEVYIVNHPDTAYKVAQDLTQTYVDKDANGTVLGGSNTDFYNLVIWGVVSEDATDCKLMCNVPDGAYKDDGGLQATNDLSQTAVYTIPEDYQGTGFLIARLTVQESAGTYTILQNSSLLGQLPSTAAGGGSAGGNEFADDVFRIQDDGDASKEIAFQASGLTTATTRTITMPDADVDLGDIGGTPTFYHGEFLLTTNLDTTSSTYANIDATNIKQSVTLVGGETVVARFFLSRVIQIAASTATYKLVADTTDADTVVEPQWELTSSGSIAVMAQWTGLGSGTFDFKPQFKTSASTARLSSKTAVTWEVVVYA